MSLFDDCLIRVAPDGQVQARLGVGLLDDYLEFVAARCRPNTVLAVAFDLKVFFAFVSKPAVEVCSADVLAFISAQRAGGDGRGVRAVDEAGGLSSRTVARRLSSVSGLFGYLLARGDVTANPVPRGLPTRREQLGQRQRGGLVRRPRTLPRVLDPAEVDALLMLLGSSSQRFVRQ
jgi:integrase/recombinase XerD